MSSYTDSSAVQREAINMLCTRHIGGGSTREVWTSGLLPDCVVKLESGDQNFQNVLEWETWQQVKDTKFASWFAPCKHISACGVVLVQTLTTVPGMSDLPEKMPAFFCDFKRSNYGMLNGKLVCHDYGLMYSLIHNGLTKRMRKADWHDNVTGVL